MRRIFLDTSSLIKLYHTEFDSAQLRQQLQPSDILIVSGLTQVEVHSAIGRKLRRGDLSETIAQITAQLFEQDWPNFQLIPLDAECLSSATRLLRHHALLALRSLDAIQLAAALMAGELNAFFTHDARLREAAAAEGLPVR